MKIKWYGHSCFVFTASDGTRLVTDPFDGSIGYKIPRVEADIILVSHDHYDHNYIEAISGDPVIVNTPGSHNVRGVHINGISTFHDDMKGGKRGSNIIFVFKMDGLNVCHLGDLGHILLREHVEKIGPVDVLHIPVGGTFTIDAAAAQEVVSQLKPRVIIPMHFKTQDVSLPIAPVDDFIERMGGGEELNSCFVEITSETLPVDQKIIVLKYK